LILQFIVFNRVTVAQTTLVLRSLNVGDSLLYFCITILYLVHSAVI